MTTEDLFSATNQQQSTTALFEGESPEPVIDPNRDWFEEYVGEGKKFKDERDLAKGKAHSDAFIKRLEDEMLQLRTELNTRLKLEEFVTKMNSQSTGANQTTQTVGTGTSTDGTALNAISPEDIDNIVEQKLIAKEAAVKAQNNVQSVKSKLQAAYGGDFQNTLRSKTKELGLTEEFVADLAKTSPQALLTLLGIQEGQEARQQDNVFAPRTSVNTISMSQLTPGEKTFKDYEKMRKQNPAVYWSNGVQNEIHKQALKLGERFYS